ncbi:TrmH family RNA methyltransferase [Portibacter marinus]|uniref:TrmH family RNA methyltransferase n=1 Tax=Portibacter marinus TaxID=2898660 RepID=UPI001F2AF328|nr:RNA methyltransferase [Portibacter marinus]
MISKATISFIQSLKQKKYRQKYNKFLLEGDKIITEGLKEGNISFDSIYCTPEKASLFDDIKIKYNIIDGKSIRKISNLKTPPGILAVANIPAQPEIDYIKLAGRVLYLDDLRDPGNMGTIIRSADWFGVATIVASHESVEFYNPKVIQASMGSFARVNLINAHISELKCDLPIYGTSMIGESIYEFKAPKEMILVIGSESHGVSEEVKNHSKGVLTIPRSPKSGAESLNAGVATAILLSHIMK